MGLVGGPALLEETHRLLGVPRRGRDVRGACIRRHGVPGGPEQPVHREPCDLAGDVPERHVDGADRPRVVEPVVLPAVGPDGADIQGVPAHNDWLEEPDERADQLVGALARAPEKRVAHHALVGAYRDQPHLTVAIECRRALAPRPRALPVEKGDGEVGDLHRSATLRTMCPRPCVVSLSSCACFASSSRKVRNTSVRALPDVTSSLTALKISWEFVGRPTRWRGRRVVSPAPRWASRRS